MVDVNDSMLEVLRFPGTGELHNLAEAWGSKVIVVTSGLRYITGCLEWVIRPVLEGYRDSVWDNRDGLS